MAGDSCSQTGKERRRFQRAPVTLPIEYQYQYPTPAGAVSGSGCTTTDNVSCGGLMFHTESFIPVPVFLEVRMRLEETGAPVPVFARVAWCEEACDGGYIVGVRFTGINPRLRDALNMTVMRELHREICEAALA